MNLLKRLLPPLVLLGWMLPSALAQQPTLSPPPKRKYKHAATIETTFDKSRNLTTVRLSDMNVWTNATYSQIVDMTFFFTYPGETLTTPKNVTMIIVARNSDRHFKDLRELTIKADKDSLKFGQMELLSDIAYPSGASQVLATVMPYEIFLRIANARKLDIKIRGEKYLITDKQLEAIRDLASRTVS